MTETKSLHVDVALWNRYHIMLNIRHNKCHD